MQYVSRVLNVPRALHGLVKELGLQSSITCGFGAPRGLHALKRRGDACSKVSLGYGCKKKGKKILCRIFEVTLDGS